MLQRDYLLEILIRFIETLTRALKRAVEQNDLSGCREAERAVADLLELDPETAMVLAPASPVQMMELSNVGSAVASYVGYTLDRVADIYEDGGDEATAELRRAQAEAVADAYGCDLMDVPDELDELDRELFG